MPVLDYRQVRPHLSSKIFSGLSLFPPSKPPLICESIGVLGSLAKRVAKAKSLEKSRSHTMNHVDYTPREQYYETYPDFRHVAAFQHATRAKMT